MLRGLFPNFRADVPQVFEEISTKKSQQDVYTRQCAVSSSEHCCQVVWENEVRRLTDRPTSTRWKTCWEFHYKD